MLKSKTKAALSILKEEGFFSFFRAIYKHYIFSFIYAPYCIMKLKRFKGKNNPDIIDFAFKGCGGYFEPMQIRSEIESLLNRLRKEKPKVIMEIGTARGGNLFLFSRVAPEDAVIISLDLPGRQKGASYSWWKMPVFKSFARKQQKIILVRGDSHDTDTLENVRHILKGRKIDFLFIDGDHTYEGVKKDFEFFSPLVRRGGTIAFHDIVDHPHEQDTNVHKFWEEINKKFRYKEIIENKNQKWAGLGLLEY